MFPPENDNPSSQPVCVWRLRRDFNDRFVDSGLLDDLLLFVNRDTVVDRLGRSQVVSYFDRAVRVAICHRYVLPDGTLGASGRPDPKWLRVGDGAWVPSHDDTTECPDCARYRPQRA